MESEEDEGSEDSNYKFELHELIFAEQLGVDLDGDDYAGELVQTAARALHVLPEGWEMDLAATDQGQVPFYYEVASGVSQWMHPYLEDFQQLIADRRQELEEEDDEDEEEEDEEVPVPVLVGEGLGLQQGSMVSSMLSSAKGADDEEEEEEEEGEGDEEEEDDVHAIAEEDPEPEDIAEDTAATTAAAEAMAEEMAMIMAAEAAAAEDVAALLLADMLQEEEAGLASAAIIQQQHEQVEEEQVEEEAAVAHMPEPEPELEAETVPSAVEVLAEEPVVSPIPSPPSSPAPTAPSPAPSAPMAMVMQIPSQSQSPSGSASLASSQQEDDFAAFFQLDPALLSLASCEEMHEQQMRRDAQAAASKGAKRKPKKQQPAAATAEEVLQVATEAVTPSVEPTAAPVPAAASTPEEVEAEAAGPEEFSTSLPSTAAAPPRQLDDILHDRRFTGSAPTELLDRSVDITQHYQSLFRVSTAEEVSRPAPRSAPSSSGTSSGVGAVGTLRRMVSVSRKRDEEATGGAVIKPFVPRKPMASQAAATAIAVTCSSPPRRRKRKKRGGAQGVQPQGPESGTSSSTSWVVLGAFDSYKAAERALNVFQAAHPQGGAGTHTASPPLLVTRRTQLPPIDPMPSTMSSSYGSLHSPSPSSSSSNNSLRVVRDLNRMQWLVEARRDAQRDSSHGYDPQALKTAFTRTAARHPAALQPSYLPKDKDNNENASNRVYLATFTPSTVFSAKNSKHVSGSVPVLFLAQPSASSPSPSPTRGLYDEEVSEEEVGTSQSLTSIRSIRALLKKKPAVGTGAGVRLNQTVA